MIKELRERTGVGMAKCKEALEQASGDMEKAIDNLRKAGMASAAKKEGREAKEGLIGIGEGKNGFSFVEVNSETDFVAQNDKFKQFLEDLCSEAAALAPKSLEAFLALKCKRDPTLTIDQYRALIVQSLGENIQVKRLHVIPKNSQHSVGVYSHMNGKIVTAVILSGGSGREEFAKGIAMHIAAEAPDYVRSDEVPADILEREKEIARSQVKGKPANMIDKIVEGKLKAFFDQVCLLGQKFVKDPSISIADLLAKTSKETGAKIEVVSFLRWQVGE